MNSTFVTVCIGLMTLGIWIGIAFVVAALLQVHRAAKAVEILAYRVDESVSHIHNASQKINDFTSRISSGWMRILEVTLGAIATIWQHRNNPPQERQGGEPEHHEPHS